MNITKLISTIMLLGIFALSIPVQAQKSAVKKTEKSAAKKAEMQVKLTEKVYEKLELTDSEKAKFEPIYQKYQAEKSELRQALKSTRGDRDNKKMTELSDAELESIIQGSFKAEEASLELKKKYHNEFKSVLPMEKVAKLYYLEKSLRKGHGNKSSKKSSQKRGGEKRDGEKRERK